MNPDEKQQSPDRQFQGNRQRNENNDRITDEVADDGHQTAKKCDRNDERRIREANRDNENRGQYRIDQGNRDLCTHDCGEAAVEIAESCGYFIAANRVKIVLHCVGAPVRVEASFEKETARRDNSDNSKNQQRRGAPGKMSEVLQVMRFLLERVDHGLSQTLKISER